MNEKRDDKVLKETDKTSSYSQYQNPPSDSSDSDEESKKTAQIQYKELLQDEMSSIAKIPISMKELVEQFKQLHTEITAVKNKNNELCA